MGEPIMSETAAIEAELDEFSDRIDLVDVPDSAPQDTFAQDVRDGLSRSPKSLPSKHLYDAAGSRLFERICALPEYYLTRTENLILAQYGAQIVAAAGRPCVMTELGCGSALKTQHLIEPLVADEQDVVYNPIDISPKMIHLCARRLLNRFSTLRIVAMVCEYEKGLSLAGAQFSRQKMIVFLGSSIGNMTRAESVAFLRRMHDAMASCDTALVGIDMKKDTDVLINAYNDSAGVTAGFNTNIFARMNRELDADFDSENFEYEARYSDELGRIEAHQVSKVAQSVRLGELDMVAEFQPGESIHTENSHKFSPRQFEDLCDQARLRIEEFWTDERKWFRLVLLRRSDA